MNWRALIVEDESEIRSICKSILERNFNIEVKVADSLKLAQELVQKENFDIALLDIHLPDGVGFELLNPISDTSPACKTIVMTAYNQCSEEQKACDYGVDFFLGKPFSKEKLVEALQTVMKENGKTK